VNAPPATQRLRAGLLAGLVLVAGVVAWSFRRPGREAPPSAPAAAPTVLPSGAARTEKLSFQSFKGEKQSFLLNAAEMIGQEQEEMRLKGVDYTFWYTVKGDRKQGHIKADGCVYAPSQQRASFQGNVVVRTEDGFELKTPTLVYRGDKGTARSEDPATFSRKDISGSATGLVYHAEEGKLELLADVKIHVRDPDKPPADIQAARGVALREEGTMYLEGAVQVDQQGDHLTADRFEMDFGEDRTVTRARAIENVVLKTASGAFPGTATAPAAGSGPRELRCRKLDLRFRPDRTLEEATAGPDADLTLHPGTTDEPERRRLEAKFLTFKFDEQGRLAELQSLRDTRFTTTPLQAAAGPPRTVTCGRLVAQVDPASGEPRNIEFHNDVVFVRGKQRATAQKAWYDGTAGKLYLSETPRVVDAEAGSDLQANAIGLAVRSGDVAAQESVRHLLRRTSGKGGRFFGGGEDPVLVRSRFLEYTAASRTGRYWEEALLRSGKDEVRAAEIRLQDGPAGRRLEAGGGVVSLMHPRAAAEGKEPARVEGRARDMVYEEANHRLVYKGEVSIRQGDIATRSPQATLALSPDGQGLQSLVAGEPVEVMQGERRASGTRATYTPGDETMVLVGDHVVLKDPSQEVEGRSLTFHVGDDRILVDGQRQVRTQTIIRPRKEPAIP
jgi:LPS export ABC transporter protein LptC/lipopolysaccharide transport protein LptA